MEYQYSVGMLKRIAKAYPDIYGGIPAARIKKVGIRVWFRIYIALKGISGEPPTYKECAEIFKWSSDITDLFAIVEYKADFDYALDALGRGRWQGEVLKFKKYKYFGRQQQIVIADIWGMEDEDLEMLGFPEPRKLRHKAYKNMVMLLSGESHS